MTLLHRRTTLKVMARVESAVKIAKSLLQKAKRDGKDIWLFLLEWRNVPTQGLDSSPCQRLMSRRTRSLPPVSNSLLKPKVMTIVWLARSTIAWNISMIASKTSRQWFPNAVPRHDTVTRGLLYRAAKRQCCTTVNIKQRLIHGVAEQRSADQRWEDCHIMLSRPSPDFWNLSPSPTTVQQFF